MVDGPHYAHMQLVCLSQASNLAKADAFLRIAEIP